MVTSSKKIAAAACGCIGLALVFAISATAFPKWQTQTGTVPYSEYEEKSTGMNINVEYGLWRLCISISFPPGATVPVPVAVLNRCPTLKLWGNFTAMEEQFEEGIPTEFALACDDEQ